MKLEMMMMMARSEEWVAEERGRGQVEATSRGDGNFSSLRRDTKDFQGGRMGKEFAPERESSIKGKLGL